MARVESLVLNNACTPPEPLESGVEETSFTPGTGMSLAAMSSLLASAPLPAAGELGAAAVVVGAAAVVAGAAAVVFGAVDPELLFDDEQPASVKPTIVAGMIARIRKRSDRMVMSS
jgi:hypothetical protein